LRQSVSAIYSDFALDLRLKMKIMGKVTGKVMPFWHFFKKMNGCKSLKTWYRGWELNPHAPYGAQDFKDLLSLSCPLLRTMKGFETEEDTGATALV
jgi:hypothetical protein